MLVPLLQSHAPTSHRPGFSRGSLQVLVLHASDEPATHNSNGSRDNGFGVPHEANPSVRLFGCGFLITSLAATVPKKTVVHAEATGNRRKASSDLKHKVNSGRGNDLVRVIIQPVNSWNTTLESTVQNSGGSNERQFQNFRLRAVTISAKAALELANRQDIAYVSLNREVRTLGHVSVTTGADAVRTWNCSTIDGVDGTGIGIAVLDSGIDADHTSFNNGSNLA